MTSSSTQILSFCIVNLLVYLLTNSLAAQVPSPNRLTGSGSILSSGRQTLGTRGSADTAAENRRQNPLLVPTSGTPVPLPVTSRVQAAQVIAPPAIETGNSRGSVINFDSTPSGSVTPPPPSVTPPPPIESGTPRITSNLPSPVPQVSEGTITPVSPTEFVVRELSPGLGQGLPLVDSAYVTMDRNGIIETTNFGRPANEIRTSTTVAAGEAIISDVRIIAEGSSLQQRPGSSAFPGNQTRNFAGGIRPGVKVAIPGRKPALPRRGTSTALAGNTGNNPGSAAASPGQSIFVQRPVARPTNRPAGRIPRVTSTLVPGGALGLDTSQGSATNRDPDENVARTEPTTPINANTGSSSTDDTSDPLKIRILFSPKSIELQERVKPALRQLAAQLEADKNMQIQLLSYASGEDARRLSLTRALAVRANLIAQGVESTRMLVKALGNSVADGPADRLDIVKID